MSRQNRTRVNTALGNGDPEYDVLRLDWQGRLKELGSCWVKNTPENSAAWNAQIHEAWECAYAACMSRRGDYTDDERSQAAIYVLADLQNFDPLKMDLLPYVNSRVTARLKDAYSRGMDIEYDSLEEKKTDLDDSQDDKKVNPKKGVIATSLNVSMNDEGDASFVDTVLDDSRTPEAQAQRSELYNRSMAEMAAKILNFQSMLPKTEAQQKKQRMEKMCFTEQSLNIAQFGTMDLNRSVSVDVIRAIYRDYLNFFAHMPEVLTYSSLKGLDLKTWEQILGEGAQNRLVEWQPNSNYLEAEVPRCFLENSFSLIVSKSYVSKERRRYLTELSGLLSYRFSKEDAQQILDD